MKKCLIIGGSSKIGQHIYDKKYIKTYNNNKFKNFIKFDFSITQLKKIIKKHKIEAIIYLAGITKLDDCAKNKRLSDKININYPKKIIKFLKHQNIYFLFVSSDAVYNGNSPNHKENEILKPNTTYGKQKKIIEQYIVKKLKKYSILRISRVIFDKKNYQDIIQDFLEITKNSKEFNAATDQYFNPTFIYELDKVFKFLLKSEINGIYNFCSKKRYSRFAFMSLLKKNYKTMKIRINKTTLKNLKFFDNRPSDTSMNTTKINKIFSHHNFNVSKKILKIFKKRLKNEKI
ncbi:sugar nucleotide-binding protein [Candidatus Pelagibacter bacterium nBUS_32]|uniref:sugar nucleotide-binding protein n=1 Tax=Candidatus Pelagibacter bacterium nBUS_32 TaxID=3374192 RepID=UPI003EBE5E18